VAPYDAALSLDPFLTQLMLACDLAEKYRRAATVLNNPICGDSADASHCQGLHVGTPLAESVDREAQRVILAA